MTLTLVIHLSNALLSPSERVAADHVLQATLHQRGNEPAKAAEHFAKALEADSLCWDAFEGLCELGEFSPFRLPLPLLGR